MKLINILLFSLLTSIISPLPTCQTCDTHEEGSSYSDNVICYKKWKGTIRCSPTYEENGVGPCLERGWKKCRTCDSKYENKKKKQRLIFNNRTRNKLNRFITICSYNMNNSDSCEFIEKYVTERYNELYNEKINELENNCD
jgi:hypothetical protein